MHQVHRNLQTNRVRSFVTSLYQVGADPNNDIVVELPCIVVVMSDTSRLYCCEQCIDSAVRDESLVNNRENK